MPKPVPTHCGGPAPETLFGDVFVGKLPPILAILTNQEIKTTDLYI